jgi:hypothetical protein
MAYHFTKSTIEASFWCNKCGRETMHRVDSGRRGPCLVCLAHPDPPKKKPPSPEQPSLFEGEAK